MQKPKIFHVLLAGFCLFGITMGLAQTIKESTAQTNQPQTTSSPATNFPTTAAETYKIEVNQDGIYKIGYSDLAAAGMNMTAVNPNALEMMYRGQPVAYKFMGNTDVTFSSDEYLLFYGWAFDGPRTEKQFITNNVFWLWAGGTRKEVGSAENLTTGTITSTLRTAVTKEPETLFTTTYTDQWDTFPNEPDSWYWDLVVQGSVGSTKIYTIDLPHLAASGAAAQYTIELLSRERAADIIGYTYTVRGYMNDSASYGEATWTNAKSVNITNSILHSDLNEGSNDVILEFRSSNDKAEVYLNRVTVEYQRQLTADSNQLIFTDSTGGSRRFQVSGFTETSPANMLVWNITVPTTTVQIPAGDLSNGDTYTIGSTHSAGAKFIATTLANTKTPVSIAKYIPANLEPPSGGADWIAISHANFLGAANTLAAHRKSFSEMETWVVNIQDVVNQYGYGLHLPSAIRDFLKHTLSWTPRPGYVVIFGAATYNPRYLDCDHASCPGGATKWEQYQPTFVVTDLVYEDRFQGQVPSDFSLVLLEGDDLAADMAIGRITASTATEANTAVTKIIQYDQNVMTAVPWQKNILFVADNADDGGNFYQENLLTAASHVPQHITVTQRVLTTDVVALRAAMFSDINGSGVSILNYRGHGSVDVWANEEIISTKDSSTDLWFNIGKPVVILSADCLDGNFAFPGIDALSKTLLTLKSGTTPVGAAAFWSSVGLGFTSEHSILHRGFYDGLFEQNLLTIGDAVNYAKLNYYQLGYHDSELYSFMLQGDPAMRMLKQAQYEVFLPAVIK